MADRDDPAARERNYIPPDADLMELETVVSTCAGQVALAPGDLVGEVAEPGSRGTVIA